MPIIVSAPRSGTTLLRLMVDAHPAIAIPPETGFLALGARIGDVGRAAPTQGARCPHYLEVRYEDLILDPARTLARVCEFIELPFDAVMLRYYERAADRLREHRTRRRADGRIAATAEARFEQQRATTEPPDVRRVGAWRTAMSADERARCEEAAGDLLRELGYEARR